MDAHAHLPLIATSMPAAPPARNALASFKVSENGGLVRRPTADEASITQHEFYILCAAVSVCAAASGWGGAP